MVDIYGRPEFSDGLQIVKTVEHFQDRKSDKDAFNVAEAIGSGGDVSGFSPESQYKGAVMHWDKKLKEISTGMREQLKTNVGMEGEIKRITLYRQRVQELGKQYGANRRMAADAMAAGDADRAAIFNKKAKRIGTEISNNSFNGINLSENRDGTVTQQGWEGDEKIINPDDIPIERADQLVAKIVGMSEEEALNMGVSGGQLRRQVTEKLLYESRKDPHINKSGQVAYFVAPGTRTPEGERLGAYLINGSGDKIPDSEVSGYIRIKTAKAKSDIASKGIDIKKKEQDLKKKTTVSPGNFFTQGGEAGIAQKGPGGELEFTKLPGGADAGFIGTKGSAGKGLTPPQKFKLQVDKLKQALAPFIEKGKSGFDPDTFKLTNDGRNAIVLAIKLIQKHKDDPHSLSKTEKKILGRARTAVALSDKIDRETRQSEGLPMNVEKRTTEPPQGFKLDN